MKYPSLASISEYENKKKLKTNESESSFDPAFKRRRKTIYENTEAEEVNYENRSFMNYNEEKEKEKEAFIDHKRKEMMGENSSKVKIKENPKKSNNRKEQLEEQMNNIQRFKLIEDYSMEEAEEI